jgi:hypothetical protein
MKVQNNGDALNLTFGGRDLFVPQGLSSELPDDVVHYILAKAQKWNKDVKLIADKEQEIEVLKKQLEETKKVEEPKEEKIVKPKKV